MRLDSVDTSTETLHGNKKMILGSVDTSTETLHGNKKLRLDIVDTSGDNVVIQGIIKIETIGLIKVRIQW